MNKFGELIGKVTRSYKDPDKGISFGKNSFAMLKYAHENPGCILESFDPKDGTSMRQKFIKVEKSQSKACSDDYKVVAIVERGGQQIDPIEMSINKQHWNEATWQ